MIQVPEIHVAAFSELDAATLYAILRLRSEVFIVEQDCAYPDIDGRDLEPGTRHMYTGEVSAYLRILEEPDDVARIGRVCVARAARRRGLGGVLLAAALAEIGPRTTVLAAQTYATRLYADAGFMIDGPEFDEDGIPHVPMRRPATA